MALGPDRLAQNLEAYGETLVKSGRALESECLELKRQWDLLTNILESAWIDQMSPAWKKTAQFFEEYRAMTEQLRFQLEGKAKQLRHFDEPSS